MQFQIGLLLFPRLTQLDLTGPYEVFIRFPDTDVHLVSKTLDPVVADGGMRLLPSTTFAECPKLDLVCVPGGAGMNPLLNDQETLDFLRRQASGARYVTSVCTGALVLGAAGLLRGKRATTHWMSLPMLAAFGCEPVAERVVVDGSVVTGRRSHRRDRLRPHGGIGAVRSRNRQEDSARDRVCPEPAIRLRHSRTSGCISRRSPSRSRRSSSGRARSRSRRGERPGRKRVTQLRAQAVGVVPLEFHGVM